MTGGGQGDGGGGASDYRLAYQTAYHPISEGIVQVTTAVFTVRKDGIWRRAVEEWMEEEAEEQEGEEQQQANWTWLPVQCQLI